jgi:hypothetical protein
MYIDEFGNRQLHTREAQETIWLKIAVEPKHDGGSASIVISERGGEQRYRFDLCAEAVDELVLALVPVLESEASNWEHTWVRTPNPKHRPED